MRVCVCMITPKSYRCRNLKLEYTVVYENISDKSDNGHCQIKVKVTVGLFSPFTTIQTIRSYYSSLVEARKLILSMYVHLIIIHNILTLEWFYEFLESVKS